MREKLKVLKKIFFLIAFLILAGCAGILVCAFNPSLTELLAEKVGSLQTGQNGSADDGQQGGNAGMGQPSNGSGQGNIQGGSSVKPGVNTGWMTGRGDASYELPSTQPVKPPEVVGDKMGYQPVKGDAERIPDEEADNLSNILSMGDTGNGLSFDAEYYPYYAMLEPQMQQLYNQIYANAKNLAASFAPVVTVNTEQVKTVFEAVCNDHPELFWLDTGYSCKYLRSGSCVEITLKYNDTLNNFEAAKKEFAAAAEAILAGARAQSSDLEKERYVHDALMQTVEYNVQAAMNQSAFSALVNGESVCAGYARAFQYLMQQLSIPCYYCTGTAGEDHAWNIVKLKDNYYNVDVTWDDTRTPTYDYFNKTDEAFASTHVRTSLSVYLPACVEATGGVEGTILSTEVAAMINQNPTKPLEWPGKPHFDTGGNGMTAEEKKAENLAKAGITADEVRETIQEYYADCLKLLKAAGKGEQSFTNVIPESLWNAVERAYSSGEYKKGYVDEALKELGVENFAIQLQAQRLGGGYYRLYHNVYTY